uniref:Uncharacterized protein n=1 Tax=Eutreptiella gymnastica TaxID=73025 RepID=A0A7S1J6A5_9EUGL|mmetsp:Transcript_70706/g.124581  ORF Transcript_70706/g.124581 Transcript_70706/m.124581 type:complete len:105 (+) Transcript_70706:992-1306(+)
MEVQHSAIQSRKQRPTSWGVNLTMCLPYLCTCTETWPLRLPLTTAAPAHSHIPKLAPGLRLPPTATPSASPLQGFNALKLCFLTMDARVEHCAAPAELGAAGLR